MAITGEKFLMLSKAVFFDVSCHALDRLREHSGVDVTEEGALALFEDSRQVRPGEMVLMGYRPRYQARLSAGQKSWYFRFLLFGQELIAVVTEGFTSGQYAWVTTYAPTPQSEIYRLAEYEGLAVA